MADVVTCEKFLLLRAAGEQLRAAQSIRSLTRSFDLLRIEMQNACQNAALVVDEAMRRSEALRRQAASARQRSSAALDSNDLDLMLAERNKLRAELQAGSSHNDKGMTE